MSRSSCRVVSALSRAADLPATHVLDSCILIYARLEVLEDGRVDHA